MLNVADHEVGPRAYVWTQKDWEDMVSVNEAIACSKHLDSRLFPMVLCDSSPHLHTSKVEMLAQLHDLAPSTCLDDGDEVLYGWKIRLFLASSWISTFGNRDSAFKRLSNAYESYLLLPVSLSMHGACSMNAPALLVANPVIESSNSESYSKLNLALDRSIDRSSDSRTSRF